MNTNGDGGPGAYEDVVDILRNINQSEERQAAAVDDGVHMQTPAFVSQCIHTKQKHICM